MALLTTNAFNERSPNVGNRFLYAVEGSKLVAGTLFAITDSYRRCCLQGNQTVGRFRLG